MGISIGLNSGRGLTTISDSLLKVVDAIEGKSTITDVESAH